MSHEDSPVARAEVRSEFTKAVIAIINKNLEGFQNGDDVTDKVYEAYAVKRLFVKLVEQAKQKNHGYNEVLIPKFIAYELKKLANEADISAQTPEWILMFIEENPQPAPPKFLSEFKDVLNSASEAIDNIKQTNFIVLLFTYELRRIRDQNRTIRRIVGMSQEEIEKFCSHYSYTAEDFYQAVLGFIQSQSMLKKY